ncbi:SDR family oxidoreductase [Novosphingobium sp. JCM 18896]|nr:SDR family oxidoreductase [Novosphingobium sp. JCM 18896]
MGKLQNKIAVITGASSGIGLSIAESFVREGAHVVLFGRRQEALDAAQAAIGSNVTLVRGDVANSGDVDRLYAEASRLGPIDIVVANAGIVEVHPVTELTLDLYHRHFDTNVLGPLLTVQKALPHLRDGGSVILTGSILAAKAAKGYSLYSATKAAIRSFARSWALELRMRGIRVNVLTPGPIDTPIMDSQAAQLGVRGEEIRSTYAGMIPLGRLGKPEELASAALFLASDDSSFVTGISLEVDGGMAQV